MDERHLLTAVILNQENSSWLLTQLPVLLQPKGPDVLFYHSKKVFILEGASKTMKGNSFIVQIEEPCL